MSRTQPFEPEPSGDEASSGESAAAYDVRPGTDAYPVAEALPRVTTAQIDNPFAPPTNATPVHTGPARPGVDPYTRPIDAVRDDGAAPSSSAGTGPTAERPTGTNASAARTAPPNRPKRRIRRGPPTAPTTPIGSPLGPTTSTGPAIRLPFGRPDRRATWGPKPGARRVFSKILESEHPPTQAFSIVDRLVGSPYANPMVQIGMAGADTRETLEFTLDLAETMFRFGAGALEAETSIIAVTASFGLRNVDVDITNQSIHINYSGDDQHPVSLLRVVRSWTSNYAGLALVHQLVADIVAGDVTRREAIDQLGVITSKPKPFPRWLADVAGGIFSGSFVLFIGGSWLGALIALLSFTGVWQVLKISGKWRIPEFFSVGLASLFITASALLLWRLSVPISPAVVVAGGIMLLLPSTRLVSSVQDAINGFPVTAAGRLFSALLVFGGIFAGIITGLVVGDLFGVESIDITEIPTVTYPTWLMAVFVGVAVFSASIFEQSAPRLLLPTAGVALLGYGALLAVLGIGVGERLAPAGAAVVIGVAGRWVALRLGAPQLVVAVPAMMFLLPGLMIFRAIYGITMETEDITLGLSEIFNAFGIILAIAGGIVLGDTIARPLTKGWNTHERRRIRRR
ncbi:threonine/serine ThrE exporter family protein [Zhihengliuella halotolerans]|uniref:Uncharacterized membrane protein YjjP (DUF1212 family) n=1 Tax=Zhihengliuella halotolerans TaxID=370736 RepID=A0A4Q8A9H2_9MICC|nr:threonine/serine exporter family protein [Zhihengliuella halotolerans]RZU60584.1 uncharacterized membrane protein YjjP (DUF1212 family) [Zhihengliuella halotolerans]